MFKSAGDLSHGAVVCKSAGNLRHGDVVRDPDGPLDPFGRGASPWGVVSLITSRIGDATVEFSFEYLDQHGNPSGRTGFASYDSETDLEFRS
jgi:hypothetical protein